MKFSAPFIKLSPNKKFLITAEGKPFFWLADTWWYGLTDRTSWPEPFQQMVMKRVQQGFTVAMVVVGVPPEIPLDSDQAKSEGQHPFTADFQPNPAYFDVIEKKISYMCEQGLVPCIVGGWGPQIMTLGEENVQVFWAEIVRRFSQYPVVWCLTGEVDLSAASSLPKFQNITKYLPDFAKSALRRIKHAVLPAPSGAQQISPQVKAWIKVAESITLLDSKKLLLVHPHTANASSVILHSPPWLDVDSIQSGHDPQNTLFLVSEAFQKSQQKVFINLEPIYEGILGNDDTALQRYAFWMSLLAGATGHCYGADGLWNMRTNDHFLGHWGSSSWSEALERAGATQLGKAKIWLTSTLDWWTLKPSFDIVSPHWDNTQETTNFPLCAQTNSGFMVCYFPKERPQADYALHLPQGHKFIWIDPVTMLPFEQQGNDNSTNDKFFVPNTQSDLLLFISPDILSLAA